MLFYAKKMMNVIMNTTRMENTLKKSARLVCKFVNVSVNVAKLKLMLVLASSRARFAAARAVTYSPSRLLNNDSKKLSNEIASVLLRYPPGGHLAASAL